MSEYEAYERGVNAGLDWALGHGTEPRNPYLDEDDDPEPQPGDGPEYWTNHWFWEQRQADNCGACWKCVPDYEFMRLCSVCGNKRCPHANDHHNVCTGSNDADQEGSAYYTPPLTNWYERGSNA